MQGRRGLPGGSSLGRLLVERREASRRFGRVLSEEQIVAWADAYFETHGSWPVVKSLGAPAPEVDDTWAAINSALRKGSRGRNRSRIWNDRQHKSL